MKREPEVFFDYLRLFHCRLETPIMRVGLPMWDTSAWFQSPTAIWERMMGRLTRWLLPLVLTLGPFRKIRRAAIPLALVLARMSPLLRRGLRRAGR